MNSTKKTIEFVNKTKQDAMRFLAEAQEDVALWTMVVNECDRDIAEEHKREGRMLGKVRVGILVITVLVLLSIVCCSCRTLNGFGGDLQDWTSNNIKDK